MERGGTGFQTIVESYKECEEDKQPRVLIFPGFLDLRLFDILYQSDIELETKDISDKENALELLKIGDKTVKELQAILGYKNRGEFLKSVINPLISEGKIYRDGNPKSPTSKICISTDKKQ